MTDFDDWYAANFGSLFAEDPQELVARNALREVFNSVVEAVARKFEDKSFTEMDGIQVAEIIVSMKDKKDATNS